MVRAYIPIALFTLLNYNLLSAQTFDIQVIMSAPAPNALHWDDIWDVTIFNNISPANMPPIVDIKVTLESGPVIYEAVTKKFVVPLGETTLNADIAKTKNLNIIQEDLEQRAFFIKYNTMKFGSYKLCVELRLFDLVGDLLYTDYSCAFHDIYQFGIINLNTPFNGDTVLSESLQFSWTHVNQQSSEALFFYELDLVEILPKQSAEEAISINPKRMRQDNIPEPYLDFPQLERPLDTGKVYAWRVLAYTDARSTTRYETQTIFSKGDNTGRKEIARSDVSTFVSGIAKQPYQIALSKRSPQYFIDLEHWSERQTYFFDASLPISLSNPYAKRNLSIRLFNDNHEPIELPTSSISLEPGLNNITIDLSSAELPANAFYFAELRLGEHYNRTIKLFKPQTE
ncbi:MAG: hypothetical protein JKY52_14045 [Flavobacteriales bacterium]|nr:hypothetical protein [Flavobacteriales bacterium]